MPRNGSGTYSVPNTYSSGQTITAAIVNANFSDVGSELTNSVAKDGQTTMTGPLKAANGSVSAPSIAFGNDTDCGWYRIGADNIGFSIGGVKLLDASAAALAITGTLTTSGALTVSAGGLTVTAGGLTVTAGGLTVTAGAVSLPSGSLETADLADDAVTLAKQASGTADRLQGFDGSGNPSEVTIGTGLSLSSAALTTTASSFLLATVTVSGEDDIPIITGISASYDEYELHVAEARPSTDGVNLLFQISTDGGSNYRNTSYISGVSVVNQSGGTAADSAATGVLLNVSSGSNPVDNSSNHAWRGIIRFWPNGASTRKAAIFQGSYQSNGNGFTISTGGGTWDGGNDAVNAIRIVASSGNISGTVRLIGIKNS